MSDGIAKEVPKETQVHWAHRSVLLV